VLGHETVVFTRGIETESVKAPTVELFRGEAKVVASIARDPELD